MKAIGLLGLVFLFIPGSFFGQDATVITVDKRALVYGVRLKSASIRKDPQTRKINGIQVEVMTTSEVASPMDRFDWYVRYYDKNGKLLADTSLRQYTPSEEDDFNLSYLRINEVTGDTTVIYHPDAFDPAAQERRNRERLAKKLFYGYVGYWPPRAVRAKVSLQRASYGWTTYYAPGW